MLKEGFRHSRLGKLGFKLAKENSNEIYTVIPQLERARFGVVVWYTAQQLYSSTNDDRDPARLELHDGQQDGMVA